MNNLTKALTPYSVKDIGTIRATHHPILEKLSSIEIEKLWKSFSQDRCAGYLLVYDTTLRDFIEWLESCES